MRVYFWTIVCFWPFCVSLWAKDGEEYETHGVSQETCLNRKRHQILWMLFFDRKTILYLTVTAAQVTNVDAARSVNPLKIRVETCNYILFYITFHLFQLCWIVNPQTHFDITSHSISFNLFSLLAYSCISICLEEKGIVIPVYHLNRCVLEMGKLLSVSQPVGWRRRVTATLSAIPLSLHPSIIYRLVSYFVPQKHSPCPPSILLAGCHPNSHNCPVIFLWLLGREFLRIEHVNQIMRECIFAT